MLAKKNLSLLSRSDLRDILYARFNARITFTETRRNLAIEQKRKRHNGEYMFVTRRTVLGRMWQMKRMLFDLQFPKKMTKKQLIEAIEKPKNYFSKKYKIEEIF
jgi:hypothetical protein